MSYWYLPGDDWPWKQTGTIDQTITNPATGTSIETHIGGSATWYLILDPSPARQIQLIGRTLAADEVLYRSHAGYTWGARSSDGRTLAFKATGESNYYVWNSTLGEDVWSKWPEPIGGGSYQRMVDSEYCDALVGWLG